MNFWIFCKLLHNFYSLFLESYKYLMYLSLFSVIFKKYSKFLVPIHYAQSYFSVPNYENQNIMGFIKYVFLQVSGRAPPAPQDPEVPAEQPEAAPEAAPPASALGTPEEPQQQGQRRPGRPVRRP
jgi:hypothetical protein